MKLTAFHAGDGDCLLLASGGRSPRRILVDGGRKGTYDTNTRAFLGTLRADRKKLDLVCVSHIDDDHITGILRLVEDEVAWRAFEFARALDENQREPAAPRPPEVREVWHNGLFELVGEELGEIVENVAATVATVLAGSPRAELRELAGELDDIVTGERSSMELSRRLSPEQLRIPLNRPADGGLLQRGNAAAAAAEQIAFGALRVFLLGPSTEDIARLRAGWRKWIDANQAALQNLHRRMLEEEERLGTLSPWIVANPMLDAALGQGLSGVTPANLASLMLLVEEGAKTVLLTGDGVSSAILDGLAHHGKLDAEGRIHVNVLKVQHHGAKANVTQAFVERVTADHYVFCGNGAHHNPELEVVEAFATARLQGFGGGGRLGPARRFKFWFTSGPESPGLTDDRKQHMQEVKALVERLRRGHTSRFNVPRFLPQGRFDIVL
jgi:beta-lactamase superfamily II metal-dependent hydrolase